MNKLVKRIIGATSACALVLGMVLGANALAKKGEVKVVEKVLTTQQWYFNGDSNPANNDVQEEIQYSLKSTQSCNNKKETICMINAPESNTNPGHPDLDELVTLPSSATETVGQRIQAALSSLSPNETVVAFRSN